MAGRVDLRVPPRLIESARAAQYANREVLGARSLERQIKAKVKQRQEASERANPLQSGQREGGVLEFQQAPLQRIWRRPRRRGEVDVAVGYVRGFYQLVEGYPTIGAYRVFSADGSAYIDLQESFVTGNERIELGIINEYSVLMTLPIGGGTGELLLLRFFVRILMLNPQDDRHRYAVADLKSFIVGPSSVKSINIGMPAFVDPLVTSSNNRVYNAVHGTQYGLGVRQYWTGENLAAAAQIMQSEPHFSTSAIFYKLTGRLSLDGLATALEVQNLFKEDTGRNLIPVLGSQGFFPATRFFGGGASTFLDRAASAPPPVFGVIPGATVTDPWLISVWGNPATDEQPWPYTLEDELFAPSCNPVLPAPGLNTFGQEDTCLLAYDYHGGTYCRDQLAALGITLP